MIKYELDLHKSYDQDIKNILRSYNKQFTHNTTPISLNLYLIDEDQLIGGLSVTYVWDWVSLGDLFYKNSDMLRCLVYHAWEKFKFDAINMSAFTTVKSRYMDLEQAGFTLDKKVKINQQDTYYYMTLNQPIKPHFIKPHLIISEEPIEKFQTLLKQEVDFFNNMHQVVDVTDTFDMVAIDEKTCVGGVQSDAYGDMLYVSRIAILESYRHQKIGSTLMNHVIQYAKDQHLKYIMLGTSDFQAKPFYEKLGFKVVYKKFNHPRGYHSYTMIKML